MIYFKAGRYDESFKTNHVIKCEVKGKGKGKGKSKAIPVQPWTVPEGSRRLRLQDLKTAANEGGRIVSPTQRPPFPHPPGNIPGTHFCYRLGYSAAGRIMSMKNSNDNIGNRSRNLPGRSAFRQPRASPCTPLCTVTLLIVL